MIGSEFRLTGRQAEWVVLDYLLAMRHHEEMRDGATGSFHCVIQAEGNAASSRDELASRLQALHAQHYPGEPAAVSWRLIPEGYMFTEGRQSTSSVIACALQHSPTLSEREAYMRGVCDVWTDVTGCTDHEIVVAVTPAAPPATAPTT
ncbi:MAG: hypothetical protein AAFY28_22345 [Actinomycetota bacterium]